MPAYSAIGLNDKDLIVRLIQRDGPIPARGFPHSAEGVCRYSEMYAGKPCPWCEAERRRPAAQT